jgi:hypothetical protein
MMLSLFLAAALIAPAAAQQSFWFLNFERFQDCSWNTLNNCWHDSETLYVLNRCFPTVDDWGVPVHALMTSVNTQTVMITFYTDSQCTMQREGANNWQYRVDTCVTEHCFAVGFGCAEMVSSVQPACGGGSVWVWIVLSIFFFLACVGCVVVIQRRQRRARMLNSRNNAADQRAYNALAAQQNRPNVVYAQVQPGFVAAPVHGQGYAPGYAPAPVAQQNQYAAQQTNNYTAPAYTPPVHQQPPQYQPMPQQQQFVQVQKPQ